MLNYSKMTISIHVIRQRILGSYIYLYNSCILYRTALKLYCLRVNKTLKPMEEEDVVQNRINVYSKKEQVNSYAFEN